MTFAEPTPEMVTFFERRTNEHIDRVRRCLSVMAASTEHTEALNERARLYDASKFNPAERIPYIWLNEFYRCRCSRESFT
ncbi:MAG: DUF5662 family protein [Rubripirellula sp.]